VPLADVLNFATQYEYGTHLPCYYLANALQSVQHVFVNFKLIL